MLTGRGFILRLAALLFTAGNLWGQGLFLIGNNKKSDTIDFTKNLSDVSIDSTARGNKIKT